MRCLSTRTPRRHRRRDKRSPRSTCDREPVRPGAIRRARRSRRARPSAAPCAASREVAMYELTLAEELFVASPIALALDEAVCDRWGCDRTAALLVPGAALCRSCAATYGIGTSDIYHVRVT